DRHEQRVGAKGFGNLVNRYPAAAVGDEPSHIEAGLLQTLARMQDRFVLSDLRDDVAAGCVVLAIRLADAFDGQVIGFGGAAGPDDLERLTAKEIGGLLACLGDSAGGGGTKGMGGAGGVAEGV